MAATKNTSSESGSGRRIPWLPVSIILFILVAALFGEKGVLRMLQSRRQKVDLEQQVAEKQKTISDLKTEISKLKTDRIYIETLARKELGMVGDGEIVYQFPGEAPPSSGTAGNSGTLP
ncbi:septum formation initiator family protein [Syntrophotalea acetylenica]|jgi:cell division protein FtsB/cell division protein DivIC|uniref:FtsB family cell division protein n=1 Tax=Syntrophotalea acetylenica TaxID=29542 RepID=UPI002A35957E|nr:septum formation initiator family protein [Syntrophotalea acetylenica]MDY0261884.1 septum formation initiator family protein [Syntrophotalea acetylenica]